jgi:acyl-ACP thioesterase
MSSVRLKPRPVRTLVSVERRARFELDYWVRFDEAGADGQLRSSGYLRYAQDLAWRHSEAEGLDRAWYRAHGLQWLVRCIQLEIREPVPYGTLLRVSTEVIGWRRVWARRRTQFRVANGTNVATGIIDWVLLNAAGRPARVPDAIVAHFSGAPAFDPARLSLGEPGPDAREVGLVVRPQEVDPLGHVNNAAYLDYLDELLVTPAGRMPARETAGDRYALEYLRPAALGEPLVATIWKNGDRSSIRLSTPNGEAVTLGLVSRTQAGPNRAS